MILQDYLNDDQVNLCEETGIIIEDRDYSCEEIYQIEHKITEYMNDNCADENIYLLEEKYDESYEEYIELLGLARAKIIKENKDINERRKKIKALIDLSVDELKEKI